MSYILDFQGFKNVQNEFIVKELAIVSTDGQFYELQLFQPPCDFNELPQHLQKQVVWLEKQYHGLYWGSGCKNYNSLKDVFRGIVIDGNVYVKGRDKKKFIENLLVDFQVNVINLEDLGCPNLNILKKQTNLKVMKPCCFNHSPKHCAYVNVHVLLDWWKAEQEFQKRIEKVNLAIDHCFQKNFKFINEELICNLPKSFIVNYIDDIDEIYEKLPEKLKNDEDIQMCLKCTDHFFCLSNNFNPKRKDCYFCINKKVL
jgi:hypothetical protein